MNMLNISDLQVFYGLSQALFNVNIEVKENQTLSEAVDEYVAPEVSFNPKAAYGEVNGFKTAKIQEILLISNDKVTV